MKIVRQVGSSHVRVLFDLYHNRVSEGHLCGHLRDGRDVLGFVLIAYHPGRHEPGTGKIHHPRVV